MCAIPIIHSNFCLHFRDTMRSFTQQQQQGPLQQVQPQLAMQLQLVMQLRLVQHQQEQLQLLRVLRLVIRVQPQ